MKKIVQMMSVGTIVVAVVFLSGCAYFSKTASVQSALSEGGAPAKAGKVAVPLFLHEKYKAGKGEKVWPDSTITDRFVTGLVQQGYNVLDRAQIRKMMRENDIRPESLYQENNVQKIGLLLHADTIVLGKLTLVEKEDGTILSRKLNVRAIRVLDGSVIFSVSSIDTTLYRVLTGEDLVDQGIADMFTPKAASDTTAGKSTGSGTVKVGGSTAGGTVGGSTAGGTVEGAGDGAAKTDISSSARADAALDASGNDDSAFEDGVEGEVHAFSSNDSLYNTPEDEPPIPEEAGDEE